MPPPPPAEPLATRIFIGPVLRTQPDRRLVDLVRDGYDAAFEEIVRRYRKPLDRFAAGIVGGRSEDVTQDSLSKALLALRGSGAEIELSPWLYRIVRNTALNDLRDRAPAAEELSERLPGGRSAAAEAESREELRDLMTRLRALPEPQRAALVMRELEGLSHKEIAAALGVSGGAARQAIYRARATLREGLGLLMPLPVLRALADHAGEAGAAGGGVALGGGAWKAGMATVLIAGAVGGGVAVEHHRGQSAGPQAEAAQLAGGKRSAARSTSRPQATHRSSVTHDDNRGPDRHSNDNGGGDDSGPGQGGSLGDGDRSGSGDSASRGGSSRSGGSSHSGEGSGDSGPSSNSGSGSGSDDRHGGGSGGGGSGSSGSGSGDGGSGESGSGASSSGDGLSGGDDSGSSGPSSGGGGEIETVTTVSEPTLSDTSGSGGSSLDSGTSESGSGTSGSGDLSSGSDGSP